MTQILRMRSWRLALGLLLVASSRELPRVAGQESVEFAHEISQQVVQLVQAGKAREALPIAERVLRIYRQQLGDQHPDTAMGLQNLGYIHKMLANYETARPFFDQALKIFRRQYGEMHQDTALCYDNLGQLFDAQGESRAALAHYAQALKIRRQVLGEAHLETAITYDSIGLAYDSLGDYASARSHLEYSLKLKRGLIGEAHREIVVSMTNLGLVLDRLADYNGSRVHFEKALEINRRLFGEDHNHTAMILNNLGYVLQDQGDYAAAKNHFEQALQIGQRIHGENHPDVGMIMTNVGASAELQGKSDEALAWYERSLKSFESVYKAEHQNTAMALGNIGHSWLAKRDFAAAKKPCERALEIYRQVAGEEHALYAKSLAILGSIDLQLGDRQVARQRLEEAVRTLKKSVGEDHPDTAAAVGRLVTVELHEQRWDAVAVLLDQVRRSLRKHVVRTLPALSEKEQLLFLENHYHRGLHSALSVGLARAADARLTALSASWLLNGKAVAHEALAARTLIGRDARQANQASAGEELMSLRRRLAVASSSAPEPGQEETHRKKISDLTAREETLTRELLQIDGAASSGGWEELASLREQLPPEAMFVDILRLNVRDLELDISRQKFQSVNYVAWLTPALNQGEIQVIDLGPADAIDRAVEQVRRAMAAAGAQDSVLRREGEAAAEKQMQAELQKVAQLVWQPLASKLTGRKQLVLSPDGSLWLLPWAALPVAEDKCLLEEFSLRYVVSGRDLLKRRSAKLSTTVPLLFADPNYDLDPASVRSAIQAVFPNLNFGDLEPVHGAAKKLLSLAVARLPFTAVEAEAVSPSVERLANAKPQTYSDTYALETIVKRVHRPSQLMLSTHGFFLADQEQKAEQVRIEGARSALLTTEGKPVENPLLRCGLLFAGCNSRQSIGGDDGILTGMEIVGIDLRGTELVVLSACETGVGTVRNGEGVAGLRQAFQMAGAKAVVATLWQVPDRDSALVMSDFFANLANGQEKSQALRDAQLKRIAARREKNGAAHPFFWAAWTLTGH